MARSLGIWFSGRSWKSTEELAKKPEILQKNVAGFQQTSEGMKPVYRDEMNQIVNFLEKAQRQKLKIMNALIATREAKAKDVSRIISDPSTYAAKLLERARELTKKAAEAGLVDVTPAEYT
jgi:thymidylate synthase ThyX